MFKKVKNNLNIFRLNISSVSNHRNVKAIRTLVGAWGYGWSYFMVCNKIAILLDFSIAFNPSKQEQNRSFWNKTNMVISTHVCLLHYGPS